jgi:hypothetical protein
MKIRLLKLAIEQALRSDLQMRHGAVVLCGKTGRVLSSACNRFGAVRRFGVIHSVHAEVAALQNCSAENAVLLVVRVSGDGSLMHSRPCRDCRHVMRCRGVSKCVFTDEQGCIAHMPICRECTG